MQTCTESHLTALGCPAECLAEMESYELPLDFVKQLAAQKGFSFFKLVGFLRKYTDLVPGLVTSYTGGGWVAVISYVLANAGDLVNIATDFAEIFA